MVKPKSTGTCASYKEAFKLFYVVDNIILSHAHFSSSQFQFLSQVLNTKYFC